MNNAQSTIEKYKQLESLSDKNSFVHERHPLVKLITTVIYLTVVISFGQYQVLALLPFIIYVVVIKEISEIPLRVIWDRLKIVLPLIVGVGIFNPLLDSNELIFGWVSISMGWLSFFSLLIKGFLTVSAMILLIGTTGISGITYALRMLRLPNAFLMTFNLIYRYIEILLEEIVRMNTAYMLRAKYRKGIRITEWGSFAGHLLLRTLERAESVHKAMIARGFKGMFFFRDYRAINLWDILYLLCWSLYFIFFKCYRLGQ